MILEVKKMASVYDVAKYILSKQGRISTWKLQKLCYYAQAWSLAWHDNFYLFSEDFEAWANGPVCRNLYNRHRGMYLIQESDLTVGDFNNLSAEQIDDINTVLNYYGDKEPYWLREQTHSEAPWGNARKRGNCTDGEACEDIILKEDMGYYYGSL